MDKEIIIDENYKTTSLFDRMKVGDIYKVPYDPSRHNGIKSEASRRNKYARLSNELKGIQDIKFRVSEAVYPGFTSIIRIK